MLPLPMPAVPFTSLLEVILEGCAAIIFPDLSRARDLNPSPAIMRKKYFLLIPVLALINFGINNYYYILDTPWDPHEAMK